MRHGSPAQESHPTGDRPGARWCPGSVRTGHAAEYGGGPPFSVGDAIDTRSDAGQLVLNVLMSMSQWEREIIVERTCTAMSFKRARSVRISGRIPSGKRLGAEGRTLEDGLAEADTLTDIKAWSAVGRSLRWITSELQRRAIPTKMGCP